MRVVGILAALCAVACASRINPIPTDYCGAAVAQADDDRTFVFSLSEDSVVWFKHEKVEGGWSKWQPVADRKKMGSGPRAVRFPNGTIQVFARGTDRLFYHSMMSDTFEFSDWSKWSDMQFSSPPVPVVTSAGAVYVFGTGYDKHTVHYSQSGSLDAPDFAMGEFADLGGEDATSSPSVTVDAEGLVHVFVRGLTRGVNHIAELASSTGGWAVKFGEWEGLGGVMASSPSMPVSLNGANLLEVYGRAADKALWHRTQSATLDGSAVEWSAWKSLGGVLASAPAVAATDDGLVDVFTRATDKAIYFRSQTVDEEGTVKFKNWYTLGGMFSAAPTVTVKSSGMLFLTARGVDKAIWYSNQVESNGTRVFTSWHSLGGHTRKYPC